MNNFTKENLIVVKKEDLKAGMLAFKSGDNYFVTQGSVNGGIDTSDATANPEDVVEGKIFYNSEGQQTGKLPDSEITVEDNIVTVTAGRVVKNATASIPEMTITNDGENITVPVGYNKTEQTFTVSGGGGSTTFYKCVSVQKPSKVTRIRVEGAGTEIVNGDYEKTDLTTPSGHEVWKHITNECYCYNEWGWAWSLHTDYATSPWDALYYTEDTGEVTGPWHGSGGGGVSPNPKVSIVEVENNDKTWSGYKAVLSGGVYSFDDTVTEGLTFGNGLVPAVDGIYDEQALVMVAKLYKGVNIPQDGLIFYAPLDYIYDTAVTGQTLVTNGSQSYTTFSGVPCVLIESGYIETAENSGIVGTASRTVSFWAYPTNKQTYCPAVSIGGTSQSSGKLFNCGTRLSGSLLCYEFTTWGNDIDKSFGTADNKLHHFAYVYNSETPGTLTIYVDGVPYTHSVSGINTANGKFRLGRSTADGWEYTGYLAGVRIYDRALPKDDVLALAEEFIPF